LFTIPDATRATGLCRSRLYNLLGDGSIEAIKAGKRTLIRAESLRSYIDTLPAATIRPAKAA
jgi:hypothetical protein